jgi:putative phosphoribosyl transferase
MAMRLRQTEVGLPADGRWLDGILSHHPHVPGLILQVERSGSTLKTSRGAFITDALRNAGFATLQVGLLSHDEERKAPEVWHQVATLTTRIAAALEWIEHQPALKDLPLGIAARDAATAAVIRVASRDGSTIKAIASRSGRPDLAGLEPLKALATPLLLVTGELDDTGPGPNQQAYDQLKCAREIVIVKGASQSFEELGTLEEASRNIVSWFERWLCGAAFH